MNEFSCLFLVDHSHVVVLRISLGTVCCTTSGNVILVFEAAAQFKTSANITGRIVQLCWHIVFFSSIMDGRMDRSEQFQTCGELM